MCLGAIYWARLSRLYFANTAEDAAKNRFDDSFIYGELKQPFSERRIPTAQIMREEALAVFASGLIGPTRFGIECHGRVEQRGLRGAAGICL